MAPEQCRPSHERCFVCSRFRFAGVVNGPESTKICQVAVSTAAVLVAALAGQWLTGLHAMQQTFGARLKYLELLVPSIFGATVFFVCIYAFRLREARAFTAWVRSKLRRGPEDKSASDDPRQG